MIKKTNMMIWGWAVALAAGLAAGQGATGPGGSMQVDEPSPGTVAPPINPERESLSWNSNGKSGSLTDSQRSAMRDRRERMRQMIAQLKEKRKALDGASAEEKQERARELQTFILEKDNGDVDEGKEGARQAQLDRRSRQMEIQQEKMRLLQEKMEEKAADRAKSGHGNGGNPHGED